MDLLFQIRLLVALRCRVLVPTTGRGSGHYSLGNELRKMALMQASCVFLGAAIAWMLLAMAELVFKGVNFRCGCGLVTFTFFVACVNFDHSIIGICCRR